MSRPLRIVGCMSGTSCDGVDAVLVEVCERAGAPLDTEARVIGGASVELGGLGERLLAFSRGGALAAGEIAELRDRLSDAHVRAIREVGGGCDVVAAHGQTVFHGRATPDARGGRTWQLFEPARVARAIGVPVLADLRSGDVAAGGQGAPITPIADRVLFGSHAPCAVVNLGGFCNATLLGGDGSVAGFDVCPCNQLLDAGARRWLGAKFDTGGAVAGEGRADAGESAGLRGAWANAAGRSLGSGDERLDVLTRLESMGVGDRLATLCDAIGRAIGERVGGVPVFVAGGGARNAALVRAIEGRCAGAVSSTAVVGVDPVWREGACMAVLGGLTLRGEAATLAGVTGCAAPAPIAGSWTLPPGGGWRVVRAGGDDVG